MWRCGSLLCSYTLLYIGTKRPRGMTEHAHLAAKVRTILRNSKLFGKKNGDKRQISKGNWDLMLLPMRFLSKGNATPPQRRKWLRRSQFCNTPSVTLVTVAVLHL